MAKIEKMKLLLTLTCLTINGCFTCDAFTTSMVLSSRSRSNSNIQTKSSTSLSMSNKNNEMNSDVGVEVQELLARAKAIRDSLPEETEPLPQMSQRNLEEISNDESDPSTDVNPSVGYRLYFDIGREDGTWMDPTWGRSGRRIEGSIDVFFQINDGGNDSSLAGGDIISKMVKDNLSVSSSVL